MAPTKAIDLAEDRSKIPPRPPLCRSSTRRPTLRGLRSGMERALDFLLDSAARNELHSPSGSTGNGLTPALRVNTLPTPSAFGWRTLRVPHTTRWRLEQQHELSCPLSPAASQRLASFLAIDYPLLVVQEIGARPKFTSIQDAKKLIESVLQIVLKNDINEAFETLAPYFTVPKSELGTVTIQTLQQRNVLLARFGGPVGIEFIREELVGDSVMNLTYLEKREETGIRWKFTLYKAKKTWTIVNLTWDDKIQNL